MISFKKLISITLPLWMFTFALYAQSYNISWYKVAGGGGVSTNATYQLSGTIGQPDASAQMTGGNYSVTGGFWALCVRCSLRGSAVRPLFWGGR